MPRFSPSTSSPRPLRRAGVPLALAAGSVLLPLSALAQQQTAMATDPALRPTVSPALDRISLSVGAFYAEPKVSATVGNSFASFNTGDVTADRKALPRIAGEILLGDNHGISFEAFRYSQNYANAGTAGYTSGPFGVTGTAGLNLNFDLDVARLGYRYWFGSGNTVFGIGAGIGYYKVKLETNAFAAASANLPGLGFYGTNGNYSRQDSDDAVAPMLEVGVRHAISPDLRLFFDASGIRKGGSSGVHGSIYNAQLGAEWFPWRNVGVSLAYAVTDVDLKRDDPGLQGLRIKFQGPVAAVKARF